MIDYILECSEFFIRRWVESTLRLWYNNNTKMRTSWPPDNKAEYLPTILKVKKYDRPSFRMLRIFYETIG